MADGPPSPASETDSTADATATAPILRATDVTKIYSRGPEPGRIGRALGRRSPAKVSALDGVSLTIDSGEIVGLAGPSGSGKSTLLHLLAGLDVPTEGTVRFRDEEISSYSARQRTRFRLDHVGIVFQEFHLLESLSARANVALPLVEQGIGKRERRRRASDLLERLGLGDRLTHRPGELSGGERQRVAIARALVTDPTYVIADEPTGELDSETGRQILAEFERVAEDRAVIIASHDQPALDIADRVLRLRDGTLEGADTEGVDAIEAR